MKDGFTINEEKGSDQKRYFTVSGKDGKREYYRLGHFDSKIEANTLITNLTQYKKKGLRDGQEIDPNQKRRKRTCP